MVSALAPPLRIVLWGLVLVGALLALGAVVMVFRRMARSRLDQLTGPALTIEKLEKLRSSGQISDDEFRTLRRAALGMRDGPAGARNDAPSDAGEKRDSELSGPAEDDDDNDEAGPEGPPNGGAPQDS